MGGTSFTMGLAECSGACKATILEIWWTTISVNVPSWTWGCPEVFPNLPGVLQGASAPDQGQVTSLSALTRKQQPGIFEQSQTLLGDNGPLNWRIVLGNAVQQFGGVAVSGVVGCGLG